MDPLLPKPLPDFEASILELAKDKGVWSTDGAPSGTASLPDARLPGLSLLEDLVQAGKLDEEAIGLLALELIGRSRHQPGSFQGPEEEAGTALTVPLSWKGYTQLQPIGMGGGGMVYRAWDPQLDRWVALKFPRHDACRNLHRLLREARAQAKVDHPHILKVHEVGEHDGQPFIAMQLVQGSTLQTVRNRLTFEQKLRLIMQVADGLQAAHQQGLVHLDLKPANILVEMTDEGEAWPFLTDFGLVRALGSGAAAGSPKHASLGGTPGFASPEQARGELDQVDRRSDVFSLGATLYYLLTGVRPYETMDPEAMAAQDPVPLRALAPHLPADMAAIVAKCLKPLPGDRYATTRELALDLGRFLEREPVRARPATRTYRLVRWLQRQHLKVLVYAAGGLLLALGAWSLQAARRERLKTRLAVRYGQEVETIEQMLRTAHLSRLHDRRPTLDLVRKAMERIRDEMQSLGAPAYGPGSFALGEGEFALGNTDLAWTYINQAWQAEFRTPACAQIRGRLLTAIFLREKAQLRGEDPQARERALRLLERDYRDPALAALRIARDGALNTPYLMALEAYLQGDLAGALKDVEDLDRTAPWLYEAEYLASEIHGGLAKADLEEGRRKAAGIHLEAAGKALKRTLDVAPSDPQNWVLWGWWCLDMADFLDGNPAAVSRWVARGRGAFTTAMEVDPSYQGADEGLAQTFAKLANAARDRGEDPMPLLDRSVAYSESSLAKMGPSMLSPDHAWILIYRAEERLLRGEDARPDLASALAHLRKAQLRGSGYNVLKGLEGALGLRAQAAYAHGEDPAADVTEALQWAEAIGRMDPGDAAQRFAIFKLRLERGELETAGGRPASEPVDQILADLHSLPPAVSGQPAWRWFLGKALGLKALQSGLHGLEAGAAFAACVGTLEAAQPLLPGEPDCGKDLARWLLVAGSWRQHRGGPGPNLPAAKLLDQGLRTVLPLRRSHPYDQGLRVTELALKALLARAQGSPSPRAEHSLGQALGGDPWVKAFAGPWVVAGSGR